MTSQDGLEPSPVEYARLHSLAVDHLTPLPCDFFSDLQERIQVTCIDDSHLPNVNLPPFSSIDERLALDKGGAILLSAANGGGTNAKLVEPTILGLLDVRTIANLRIELPLLRTNHSADFKAFATAEDPHIKSGCLPTEPLDIEKNEGLDWPSTCAVLADELWGILYKEKFEVAKDTLIYLQAAIKDTWTKEDGPTWEGAVLSEKIWALKHLSPQLLPMGPVTVPYVHSSPVGHLQLLSDPASLISDDLRDLEKAIFEQDVIGDPAMGPSDVFKSSATIVEENPLKSKDDSPELPLSDEMAPPPGFTSFKAKDHKVEVPLMPATPTIRCETTEILIKDVKEMLFGTASGIDEHGSSIRSSSPVDSFFRDACHEYLDIANQQLQNEQLLEADSTQRVMVPKMDFTLPNPPWVLQGAAHLTSVMELNRDGGFPPKLLGIQKLLPMLRWSPFPVEIARVVLEEELGCEKDFVAYLTHTKDHEVVDSAGLAWKPDGLRILTDNDDDDDDMEHGYFVTQRPQDIVSLVKKRKMQIEEHVESRPNSRLSLRNSFPSGDTIKTSNAESVQNHRMQASNDSFKLRSSRQEVSSFTDRDRMQETNDEREWSPMLGSSTSMSNALDNYLEIRGSKKQKLINSTYFPTNQNSKSVSPSLLSYPFGQIPKPMTEHIPIPVINPPSSPTSFIISSQMLRNRPIKHAMANLFPTAILVERDFNAHNTMSWLKLSSVERSPICSPLADEADLIISPSTGLIITTLTKIKQKPLPGQKSKVGIRDRIEKVGERYDRLVILINEGSADDTTTTLDGPSCLALAEFIGFCYSLQTSTITHFVAGGEQTLAKWVVATLVQYGIPEGNFQLIQDETLWELFLRRAGMNAYAAQAVLGELKAPDGLETGAGRRFGLAAFVEMEMEERIERFQGLLGGRRVLERVSKVLDARWS